MINSLSDRLNTLVNRTGAALKSENPLGGKNGLTMAVWGLGATAIYVGCGLLASSLLLGVELMLLAPVAIYLCRLPDLRADAASLLRALNAVAQAPNAGLGRFLVKAAEFVSENAHCALETITHLSMAKVKNYGQKILKMTQEKPLDLCLNIAALAIMGSAFGHLFVFGIAGLAPKLLLTAALGAGTYHAAAVRKKPELWNSSIDNFIAKKNLIDKCHYLTLNMMELALDNWFLTGEYLIHKHLTVVSSPASHTYNAHIETQAREKLPEEVIMSSNLVLFACNKTAQTFFKPKRP